MTAKEIKTWLCEKYNIPASTLSVTTGNSKSPYIQARIKPEPRKPGESYMHPLTYSVLFAVSLRRAALRAVYGEALASQDSGGNIQGNSIAMKAQEWAKTIDSILE